VSLDCIWGWKRSSSDQIHKLAQLIFEAGHGLQLADGKAFWSCVHIRDLSRLYILLIDDALSPVPKSTWNDLGYYLAETGEFSWGDISSQITKEAYKQRVITSDTIAIVPMEERHEFTKIARPIINYAARSKALRGQKLLGWQPKEKPLCDEIRNIVSMEVRIAKPQS
jgi:nucleoside-diphosphate-sugar epimerase